MHEVLVNRLGLSLPRKSVVRLTDRPDMTLDVYRGRKTTMQHDITITCKMLYLPSYATGIRGEITFFGTKYQIVTPQNISCIFML